MTHSGNAAGQGQGTSETWDFSQRETFGRLIQRTVEDAWHMIEALWPDDMPEDGNLAPLADELTDTFLAHSQSVPRWAWSSPQFMQFYRETVGNFYWWFALRALSQFAGERVERNHRLPSRTLPPLSSQPQQRRGRRTKGA